MYAMSCVDEKKELKMSGFVFSSQLVSIASLWVARTSLVARRNALLLSTVLRELQQYQRSIGEKIANAGFGVAKRLRGSLLHAVSTQLWHAYARAKYIALFEAFQARLQTTL